MKGILQRKLEVTWIRLTGTIGLILFLLVATMPGVYSATIIDFPRLSFEAGVLTGIAIVNPNDSNAQVTLTAYNTEGQALAMVPLVVPAGRQVSRLTSDLFGGLVPPDTIGWFQASSMSDDLSGFFLILNTEVTEFDGADPPIRSRQIAFNLIRIDDGFSTELNVVNPSQIPTMLTLTLREDDSEIVREVPLSAHGVLRVDVQDFFEVESVESGAYVVASASEDLAGFQLVRSGDGDLLGLNARNVNEPLNTLYFPQMAVQGGFTAELGVVNYSQEQILISIIGHRPDGSLLVAEAQENPVVVALDPGQGIRRDLAELFGFQGDALIEGWLEVRANTEAINGYLSYRIPATGALAAVAPVAQGTTRGLLAHLATSGGFFTGIAALNSSAFPANVRIVALSGQGLIRGSFATVLPPGAQFSELITDVIPAAADQDSGFVLVRSDIPLFLSALFGSDSVLANIPPRSAPPFFQPDAGLPLSRISPSIALVPPSMMRQFQVTQGQGPFTWRVNGIPGGSAEAGTIDDAGLYTAPSVMPLNLPVTITAASPASGTVAASVDVLSNDAFISGLGLVQSVAYLGGLQRLFAAELAVAGAAAQGDVVLGQAPSSGIFEVGPPNDRDPIVEFPGENIVKIIPFLARDGMEYLLAAGQVSGTIRRFNPVSETSQTVASSLNAPTTLYLDPVTDNLLVGEATQISIIPRSQLESDLMAGPTAIEAPETEEIRKSVLSPIQSVGGITVDRCTQDIYVSETSGGRVLRIVRTTGLIQEVATGLSSPTEILGLYRRGLSCPQAFHLLVIERGANQISLLIPSEDLVISPWTPTLLANDLTFLPQESPFVETDSVIVAELIDGESGQISLVDVLSLYEEDPINPPTNPNLGNPSDPPGPDLAISSASGVDGITVSVDVAFRSGDEDNQLGGPDNITAIVMSIDYDETRLTFDPSDNNGNLIPDAILPSLPGDFSMFVLFDPEDTDGEIDIVIADLTAPLASLPDTSLFSIAFNTLPGALGTADLGFSTLPIVSIADVTGNGHALDEVIDGTVSISPVP